MKKALFMIIGLLLLLPTALAKLELDSINFDPAIIAAGDEVDIVIQYHTDSTMIKENKVGNTDYVFKVNLLPDDTLTKNYVTISDMEGDDNHGTLYSGDTYNKVFRIKVNNNAPAGNYEFKLEGRWIYKGVEEEETQYLKFIMPVKKEGIILDISTITTFPGVVRPGDDEVKITTFIENVGEKDAKSVEVNLNLPEGIESSYTNNNRVWIGGLSSGESKEVNFYVDIDEDIQKNVYDINYDFDYMDLDNNQYNKVRNVPFLIKSRPYLEVVDVIGEGIAGKTSKMTVIIKNTGTESAESVDVRIIKQNSQPFNMDVRSDYIGELEPGEEGTAVFYIDVNSDAELKKHDFKLLIRSKGDSDEGDDTIYTYNRRATFEVVSKSLNYYLLLGLIGTIIVAGVIIYTRRKK